MWRGGEKHFERTVLACKVKNKSGRHLTFRFYLLQKVFFYNFSQLVGDFGKITIQIQGLDRDPVTAHAILPLRDHLIIRPGIQNHSGNFMRTVCQFRSFIFHIGEDLIQIGGTNLWHVKLHLQNKELCFDNT